MKYSIALIVCLLAVGVSQAVEVCVGPMANLVCTTLPGTTVPRLVAACEELRKRAGQNPAGWDNALCLLELTRRGSKDFAREEAEAQARADGKVAIRAALDDHDTDFPEPERAYCGDGTVDDFDDFTEECDDGNQTPSDGCQPECVLPVCGDGYLDPGEECDDGGTEDGDGCSAICENE